MDIRTSVNSGEVWNQELLDAVKVDTAGRGNIRWTEGCKISREMKSDEDMNDYLKYAAQWSQAQKVRKSVEI